MSTTKLTGRQREFLGKFLDLYCEEREPLHYSRVAERLGVGNITAYDMLKLLEDRGLVRAEYLLPERGQGPGRSTIVFAPTSDTRSHYASLSGTQEGEAEWSLVREHIMESLRSEQHADYEHLLDTFEARIPERRTPVLHAAEMVTAVIVALHQVMGSTTANLQPYLDRLGVSEELNLSGLAGLSLGLSFVERANRRLSKILASYAASYQDILSELSPETRRRLYRLAQDIVRLLQLQSDHVTSL